ncbi:hypothetical protein M378DRAFT_1057222, partial [Amanita muscaria Koide BX008]
LLNPQQTPTPLGQPPPQPAQPGHSAFCAAAQHSQQSHFQAPTPPAHNPHRILPQSLPPPPSEQSAIYANYSQGLGHQQRQYDVPPPVAQPSPQPVEPNYNSYQPTAGYALQQPVASPQPPLYYICPQPQRQHQQQRFYRTPSPQDIRPAKRQRFDDPNLNRQAYHHPPLPPQQVPPLPAQIAGVYRGQSQRSGYGDGYGCLNNLQPSANTGGRGARGESMSSEIADRNPGGSYMDAGGGGRRGQSGGGVHAHWSRGNFGEAASMQAEGRNAIPTSAEPATDTVPIATQFQGAQGFSISGTMLTNIGTNTGVHNATTVNNYGGTHGVSLSVLHRLIDLTELNFKAWKT